MSTINVLLSKSNIANVVAAVVVIVSLVAAIVPQLEVDQFVVNLAFAGAGYLFGAQAYKKINATT